MKRKWIFLKGPLWRPPTLVFPSSKSLLADASIPFGHLPSEPVQTSNISPFFRFSCFPSPSSPLWITRVFSLKSQSDFVIPLSKQPHRLHNFYGIQYKHGNFIDKALCDLVLDYLSSYLPHHTLTLPTPWGPICHSQNIWDHFLVSVCLLMLVLLSEVLYSPRFP